MNTQETVTTRVAQARSFLFVPGSRPERFVKAARSGADAIILDLEDGVPPPDKPVRGRSGRACCGRHRLMSLEGKVALITSGGADIGSTCAELFAQKVLPRSQLENENPASRRQP